MVTSCGVPPNSIVYFTGLRSSPPPIQNTTGGDSALARHRRFVAALGFGPKTLERILRLQGVLALARVPDQRHIGLAPLAKQAGYADQPHLTREVAALAGVTPRVLLEETRRSCGPNHDQEASYGGVRRALLAAR